MAPAAFLVPRASTARPPRSRRAKSGDGACARFGDGTPGTLMRVGRLRDYWSGRPRADCADARFLATEQLHALRHTSYRDLRARADGRTQVESIAGLSGEPLRRRTRITRVRRTGDEELRIVVRVDDGSLLGRLKPLVEDLVLATPDGEMVGEYALPPRADDPRRFHYG